MVLELIQVLTQRVFAAQSPKDLTATLEQLATRFGYRGAVLVEFSHDKLGVRALIDTDESRGATIRGMLNAKEVAFAMDGLRQRLEGDGPFELKGLAAGQSDPHMQTWARVWSDDSFVIPVREGQDVAGVLALVGGLRPEKSYESALVHLAYNLLVRLRAIQSAPESERALTPRELEVMRLSSQGKSSKEIGEVLQISMRTVNAHVEHAIAKLGVRNRIQAIAELGRRGLLAP